MDYRKGHDILVKKKECDKIKYCELDIPCSECDFYITPEEHRYAREIAIYALKKQIPKKPKIIDEFDFEIDIDDFIHTKRGLCQVCSQMIVECKADYCPSCGNAIDWS